MTQDANNLKAVHELGKLYDSFQDKKLLCDFFLENSMSFIDADYGYLFLNGGNNMLWLEAVAGAKEEEALAVKKEAQALFEKAQAVTVDHRLWIPLIALNQPIGMACYGRDSSKPAFSESDMLMISSLVRQVAGSLKSLVLYEETVRMERLAAVGQTVGIVMHEVKNIIQLAKFAEEFLRRGVQKMDERNLTRGLEGVQKALKDMDGFIYEMLSLTKNYKIVPQPVEMRELLEELEHDFKERARHMNVVLKFSLDESFKDAEGEPRSLYRVLVNMIKNAIEARDKSKPESYVAIHVKQKDEIYYQIVIEDNGMGMSDEVQAKLFQAFFSTKGEKGTGLGLMIIERTIHAHHGEIKIESELGKFTRFTLTLPRKLANENENP